MLDLFWCFLKKPIGDFHVQGSGCLTSCFGVYFEYFSITKGIQAITLCWWARPVRCEFVFTIMVSCMSQIQLEPHPDWSPRGF